MYIYFKSRLQPCHIFLFISSRDCNHFTLYNLLPPGSFLAQLQSSVGLLRAMHARRGPDKHTGARKRAKKTEEAKAATAAAALERRRQAAASQKASIHEASQVQAQAAKGQLVQSMHSVARAPVVEDSAAFSTVFSAPCPVQCPVQLPPASLAHDVSSTQPAHAASPAHTPALEPSPAHTPAPVHEYTPSPTPSPSPAPAPAPSPASAPAPAPAPAAPDSNQAPCGPCDDDVDCDDLGDGDLDSSLKEGGVVSKYLWHVRHQLQWEDTGTWGGEGPAPAKKWLLKHVKKNQGAAKVCGCGVWVVGCGVIRFVAGIRLAC